MLENEYENVRKLQGLLERRQWYVWKFYVYFITVLLTIWCGLIQLIKSLIIRKFQSVVSDSMTKIGQNVVMENVSDVQIAQVV